jgi:hypothetical protein
VIEPPQRVYDEYHESSIVTRGRMEKGGSEKEEATAGLAEARESGALGVSGSKQWKNKGAPANLPVLHRCG